MHALRRYVQGSLDARGWKPADLARASGMSPQLVSQLLNDERDRLSSIPKEPTIAGIAKAFGVSESVVIGHVFEALGYDLNVVRTEIDLSSLNDAQLLDELATRLVARRKPPDFAMADGTVIQIKDPVRELERMEREGPQVPDDVAARDEGRPSMGEMFRQSQDQDTDTEQGQDTP